MLQDINYDMRPWLANYDKGVLPEIEIPEQSICAYLDFAAKKYGSRTAVEFKNYKLSYAQLQKKAEHFAAALHKNGVHRGDRVAIMLPNLPQTYIAFWGVMKAGATAIMINPLYMEAELVHTFNDAKINHVIVLDLFWSKIANLKDKVNIKKFYVTEVSDCLAFPLNHFHKFIARQKKSFVRVPYDVKNILKFKDMLKEKSHHSAKITDAKNSIALIQYTGGTTGTSKGAMLSHYNLCANVEQLKEYVHENPKNKQIFLALLPIFHIFGLTITLLLPAALAAKCVPMPNYVPADLLRAFKKYKFTAFIAAPSVFISLLQQKNLGKYDLRTLKFCISGSAAMPAEWSNKFHEITGTPVTEGFGLTEASPVTHINPIYGKQKIASIGFPLPNTEAKIVDLETGTIEMPVGEVGELIIKGPQVMLGYLNNDIETAQTIRDGWLHTGDIAHMDNDGFFTIADRKKDLIIIGGYNVYPREVDDVLLSHPKIQEAVTLGVFHRTRGESIKAFIVPKAGVELSKNEIISYCLQKLANFKVPKIIEFREELPKSQVGKVLRRVLRDEENNQGTKND